MKNIALVLVSLFVSMGINSSDLPASVSAEYFGCKLDEGKTLNDLNDWISEWNKWMNSTDLGDYEASLLTPLYRSPNDEIDFMWVGRTDTWQELFRGQSAYRASGLAATFPAASCPFQFIARQIPAGGANLEAELNEDEFVAAYWLCDIEEGKTLSDVHQAQVSRMNNVVKNGNKISSRIVIPRQGVPSVLRNNDFVMLYASPSLEQWGANIDNYQNNIEGKGDDNAGDGVFSCGNSTVYVGSSIR